MKRRYFIRRGPGSDWTEASAKAFHLACLRFIKDRAAGQTELWEGWGFCVVEGEAVTV